MTVAPDARKIVLLELSSRELKDFWLNYSAGVWYWDLNSIYSRVDDTGLRAGLPVASTITTIGSVTCDSLDLLMVNSVAEVEAAESRFYWDSANKICYISIVNFDRPETHEIGVSVVSGYANQASVYSGFIYDGRIKSVPAVSKAKDPLFFGKISFDSGSVILINSDGALDNIVEDDTIVGNAAKILVGFDDDAYGDFTQVYRGYVQRVTITREELEIEMMDQRRALSTPMPTAYFSSVAYPNMDTNNDGKPIPKAYGSLKKVQATCLNQKQNPIAVDWVYQVCDTSLQAINSISTAYYEQKDTRVLIPVTIKSTNLTKATVGSIPGGGFSIDKTEQFGTGATPAAGDGPPEIWVDMVGYVDDSAVVIQNATYVIESLLGTYSLVPFDYVSFDLVEWAVAKAATPNVALYIEDSTDVITVIEEICASCEGNFIIKDDGRYTMRIYDPNRASVYYFRNYDLMDVPVLTYSIENSLTSVMVGHSKDYSSNKYKYLKDTSLEEDNYILFKKYYEKKFDTLLTNAIDAQAFATDILGIAGVINKQVQFVTKMQALDLEIMDFIEIDIARPNKSMVGKALCEVINITKDFSTMTIGITGRIISITPTDINVGTWAPFAPSMPDYV